MIFQISVVPSVGDPDLNVTFGENQFLENRVGRDEVILCPPLTDNVIEILVFAYNSYSTYDLRAGAIDPDRYLRPHQCGGPIPHIAAYDRGFHSGRLGWAGPSSFFQRNTDLGTKHLRNEVNGNGPERSSYSCDRDANQRGP